MQTQKMSLANIKGKLSRAEMKKIMAGQAGPCKISCTKWNQTKLVMDSGTCTQGTVTIGNTTATTCDCSLSGGSDCFNNGA